MKAAPFEKIYLEIGNLCNLQCSFCPTVDRHGKQISKTQLRERLNQIKPLAKRVCFHVMGEPLNHPEFCEFVQIAEELEVPLEITTNGTQLSEKTVTALLSTTVVQVNFSAQSFVDNFPKADPNTYWEKIIAFCQKAMIERPDLYLNIRLWNTNSSSSTASDGDFNDQLLSLIEKTFSCTINRAINHRLNKSKRVKDRLYLHFDSRFEWPDPKSPLGDTKGTCWGTRSHIAILAEGTVVPCCLDKEARLSLGNIDTSPLLEILETERFAKMKQGFEQGNLVEDLCRKCDYVRRFRS